MAYKDLRAFIKTLEKEGELVRVKAQVDPELEITEIVDRVTKRSGPAILFENVKGHDMPVLINTFGSPRRMELALGTDDMEALGESFIGLAKTRPPKSAKEAMELLRKAKEVLSYPPKRVRKGACQEVVLTGDDIDLTRIPVLKCWPQDAGPFMTLPQVITKDPETGERNVGMYRMQVFDARTTGMHWQIHKGGARHYFEAQRKGDEAVDGSGAGASSAKAVSGTNGGSDATGSKGREVADQDEGEGRAPLIPVAVAFGGDPAQMFASALPLPEGLDEYLFAGFLRKENVELVRCVTQPELEVPANAEIVLEGYVDPNEPLVTEGPFGDHTGYYSLADQYPLFHVTAITHRKKPIYPTTVVGVPPQEDAWMGKAIERIFLPMARFLHPEIVDMNMPVEGGFHNLLIVSIRKRYPGHAKRVMNAVWGTGQMMFTKILVVVDHWVDVHDPGMVLWVASHCMDPARDSVVLEGFPCDDLEHASPMHRIGGKLGIDATEKWASEGHSRPWPEVIRMAPEVQEQVRARWKEFGLGAYPEKKSSFWP